MKVDKTTVLAAAGIGLAIYFYMQNQQQQQLLQQRIAQDLANRNLAKPRSNTAQDIQNWANTILSIYGNVSALWKPGGPFYKASPEVQQVLAASRYFVP